MSDNVKVLTDSGNYTVVRNAVINDKTISWKAKGLLIFMLSQSAEWDFSINGLVACSKDGKTAVISALQELRDAGYVKIEQTKDGQGRFSGYQYTVADQPTLLSENHDEPDTKSECPKSVCSKSAYGKQVRITNNNYNKYQQEQILTGTNIMASVKPDEREKSLPSKNWIRASIASFAVGNQELYDALEGWVEVRQKMRNVPFTERALNIALRKLYGLTNGNQDEMVELVNRAIESGWRTFYKPAQKHTKTRNGESIATIDSVTAMFERMNAEEEENGIDENTASIGDNDDSLWG